MIKKYIIDGNNLIGKISELWSLQKSDRQLSRVKLVKILDRYFRDKKYKVSLHLDGFEGEHIPSSFCRIHYSDNKTADANIKSEIDGEKNRRTLAVVSSDHSVQNYAKVNSCQILRSEEFASSLKQKTKNKSEEEIARTISDDEIKKMFGV